MPARERRLGTQPVDIARWAKSRQCRCKARFAFPVPCMDTRTTGGNVLTDPGFENHIAWYGSSTIPAHVNLPDPRFKTGWIVGNLADPGFTVVTTSSPDTGTYHAKATTLANLTDVSTVDLWSLKDWDCTSRFGYSAVAQPDDLIDWSVRVKASQVSSGTPTNRMFIGFRRADMSSISFTSVTSFALTTSYATYSIQALCPAETKFVRAYIQPITNGTPNVNTDYYVDNGSVIVT